MIASEKKKIFSKIHLIILSFIIFASGVPASFAQGGCIEGTVTHDGTGVKGVFLFPLNESDQWTKIGGTDSNGDFTISGLEEGTYRLLIWTAHLEDSLYANQWYDGKGSIYEADEIEVTEGSCSSVNIDLQTGVCIKGRVLDPDGDPFEGSVYAYTPNGQHAFSVLSFFSLSEFDAEGNFTIQGLIPDQLYWIVAFDEDHSYIPTGYLSYPMPLDDDRFDVNWLFEYGKGLDDVTSPSSGCMNLLPKITMIPYASVSGTIEGIELEAGETLVVEAYLKKQINRQDQIIFWDATNAERKDSQYQYILDGLIPGGYLLIAYVEEAGGGYSYLASANDGTPINLCNSSFQDRSDENDADWLSYLKEQGIQTVSVPEQQEVNFSLQQYGSIKGMVTIDGDAKEGLSVFAERIDGDEAIAYGCNDEGDATTDTGGTYSIEQLSPGYYKVWVEYDGMATYFDNEDEECRASLIQVPLSQEVTPVNFSISEPTGIISGTVNFSGETPDDGKIDVFLYSSSYEQVDHQEIDDAGGYSYTFAKLPDGNYYVKVVDTSPDEGKDPFSMLYYDGKTTIKDAVRLTIENGNVLENINFSLERSSAGSLTGRLTDVHGAAIEGAAIYVFPELAKPKGLPDTSTSGDGSYEVENLAPGAYWVLAAADDSAMILYRNLSAQPMDILSAAEKVAHVTAVVVQAGENTSGINLTHYEGSIAGTVISEHHGIPIEGARVSVLSDSGYFGKAETGPEGKYTIAGLPSGTYTVFIGPGEACYHEKEYYLDSPIWGLAVPVTVTAPDEKKQVDFDLPLNIYGGSPSVSSVSPERIKVGTTPVVITISGENFIDTPRVFIGTHESTEVSWIDAATITAKTPTGIPEGIYPLKVKNPSGQSGVLVDALEFYSATADQLNITSITPTEGIPPVDVVIKGENFKKEGTSKLPEVKLGSVALANITYINTTEITTTVPVDKSLTPGTYNLKVTNPDGESDILKNAFTVLAQEPAPPSIISVSPDNGKRGQVLIVAITGVSTHFSQQETTVSFGSGISVTGITVESEIKISAHITIDTSADLGSRTVVVTTGDETVEKQDGFTVTGPAGIVSVSPSQAEQGDSLSITIIGEQTHFLQGATSVDFGSGITINSVTVADSTELLVSISISVFAEPGPRNIMVTTGEEKVQKPSGFTVLSQGDFPVIISVVPDSAEQGETLSVSLEGEDTHFDEQTTVNFGAGIEAGDITVDDSTHLTVQITIDPVATPGLRNVIATSGDEVATKSAGFSVVEAGSVPSATIFPAVGASGKFLPRIMMVFIRGKNTHFEHGVTEVSFANQGIQIMGKACFGSKLIVMVIGILPGSEKGPGDVTITTGAEVIVLENGFTVR